MNDIINLHHIADGIRRYTAGATRVRVHTDEDWEETLHITVWDGSTIVCTVEPEYGGYPPCDITARRYYCFGEETSVEDLGTYTFAGVYEGDDILDFATWIEREIIR